MFKITSSERLVMAPPNQSWTLEPGANHFEGTLPDAVAEKLRELVKKGTVKVETLDFNAKASPWEPEPKAKTDAGEVAAPPNAPPPTTAVASHDSLPPADPVTAMSEVVGKPSGFFGKK